MKNPITDDEVPMLDDLLRTVDGKAVCRVCGIETKNLYHTDHGYVCKQDLRRRRRRKVEIEEDV